MATKIIGVEGAEYCPYCNSMCFGYRLKIIRTGRADPFWPKYIPQIKEICEDCGKFIKFAKQEPELIDRINDQLKEIKL